MNNQIKIGLIYQLQSLQNVHDACKTTERGIAMKKLINEDIENVKKWVKLLRDESERLQAAIKLGRLGIQTRGGMTMTRGTLQSATEARIQDMDFSPAFEALRDQRAEVRCEVAFALGEWADETAVEVLKKLTIDENKDSSTDVRAAAADALGKIGGTRSVAILQRLAMDDPDEDVRTRAIGVLGSLAAKAEPKLVTVRTPSVRARGASQPTPPKIQVSRETEKVLDLLKQIRVNDQSDYVRDVADETLEDLGE